LSAEIVKKISEFKKRGKKPFSKNENIDILWRGLPYIDICKMEKWEVEN
jgi:hypothetical protein